MKKDYLDFTDEELTAFGNVFTLNENGYLYISEAEMKKISSENENARIIKEHYNRHKVGKSNAPILRRQLVFAALKKVNSKLEHSDFLIYDPSKIKVYSITNVSKYLGYIKTVLGNKEVHKNGEESFFRGQSSFDWTLKPSIYREEKWIENEDIMIKEMIRRFPDFLNDTKRIEILTKLQHYGLPTRLLDLSENPLIALFFACSDISVASEDGRIYYFSPSERCVKYSDSDLVAILSNISKMNGSFGTGNLEEEKRRFLWFIQEEKNNFDDQIKNDTIEKCCFVKTNLNNERIKSQTGAFIITGTGKTKSDVKEIEDDFSKNNILFLVDRNSKNKILSELKQIGIYEGSIYPDISKNTDFIKNKYKS